MAISHSRPITISHLDIYLFSIFLLFILRKGLLDLDLNWDNLAYHLPFAALRSGLFTSTEYKLGGLQSYYDGFPPLHDYIRGALWKLTNNPNSVNILSIFTFAIVTIILRCFAKASLFVTAIAIAAIPVIHVQLAGGHVDILSNLPFAVALTLATLAFVDQRNDASILYLTIVGCLAFSANVKLQFVPLSLIALTVTSLLFYIKYFSAENVDQKWLFYLATAVGFLLIGWLPVRSTVLFNNPIYPVSINILGYSLPGTIGTDTYDIYPEYLQHVHSIWKWILSVSEFHAYDFRRIAYTVGQGEVPTSAKSFRMGGFLFTYVLLSLFTFALLISRLENRKGVYIFIIFFLVTLAIGSVPSSHELRYFSFWMVYLVTTNLALLWRSDWGTQLLRQFYAVTCVASFLFVGSVTGYYYVWPQGISIEGLIREMRIRDKLDVSFVPGLTYCVGEDWKAILIAPYFHRDLRPYTVRAFADLSSCRGNQRVFHFE